MPVVSAASVLSVAGTVASDDAVSAGAVAMPVVSAASVLSDAGTVVSGDAVSFGSEMTASDSSTASISETGKKEKSIESAKSSAAALLHRFS